MATILMRYDTLDRTDSSNWSKPTGNVWRYSYVGIEHPHLKAVSDYLARYHADHLERKDGMIPCITSLEIDNEDSSDIKMWGFFDVYNYSLEKNTLKEENGKRLLGLFHLRQAEDGVCTVMDTSFVEEGDLKTPLGTFGFNKAFGIEADPGCVVDYIQVDDSFYWDADSDSDRYNQQVSTVEYTGLNQEDSEHIVDSPNAYKYVLNTTYNEDGTPHEGSAVFLHCYRGERMYTGGCIFIPLEKMQYVMKQIRKDSKIIIRMQP